MVLPSYSGLLPRRRELGFAVGACKGCRSELTRQSCQTPAWKLGWMDATMQQGIMKIESTASMVVDSGWKASKSIMAACALLGAWDRHPPEPISIPSSAMSMYVSSLPVCSKVSPLVLCLCTPLESLPALVVLKASHKLLALACSIINQGLRNGGGADHLVPDPVPEPPSSMEKGIHLMMLSTPASRARCRWNSSYPG